MNNICRKIIIPFILIQVSFRFLIGQDPWIVPRLSDEIVFDGIPDDDEWQRINMFPMVTLMPVDGNEPSEYSDIRMCFNDHYVFLGAKLTHTDIKNLQTAGKKRDFSGMNCDWFGINIDSYNDKENGMMFLTNPNGLRSDASIKNDGTIVEENEPFNFNWNTFWDVRTEIVDDVWNVEMRIPVSSLRFQDDPEKVTMGIAVMRWIPEHNEMDIFPPIPYNWGGYSQLKTSLYCEAVFEGLKSKKPLYITPYVLGGFEEGYQLNDDESEYRYHSKTVFEPGIDIKYGINPNLTLDLTVNTDFAQVEADDQQFNLTRFSLYYEEKRVFFLERASVFDFNLGGANTLFYSRRIGLHEGEPVRIWGGARVISRTGNWDLGFLDMQTASFNDLPSENFAVFRARRNIINTYSYAGGMLTSRIGVNGDYNTAYGLDCNIRIGKDDYFTFRWTQSFENGNKNNPFSLKPTRWLLTWVKRRNRGLGYDLASTYSGTEYNPGIGFQMFENYWVLRGRLKYTWVSQENSDILDHTLTFQNYNISGVPDNKLLSYNSSVIWEVNMKNGVYGIASAVYNYECLTDTFHILDNVFIPDGKFRFFNTAFTFCTPQAKPFYTAFTLEAGQYYDGLRLSPQVDPVWNVSSGLEIGATYHYDYVNFRERDQQLSNHIMGLRALYMLNTKISFSAFVQYNTAVDKVISNFRFRYNPREGSDLYIVFDEGRNTYLEREIPALPPISERSIMVKYTYTFAL